MIKTYNLIASRIKKEINELETVCSRAEQALVAAENNPSDQDFYFDSAALSLHDLYTGLERIFLFITAHLEEDIPQGKDWHRELLYQMQLEIKGIRPAVLSDQAITCLDEYLRFRHVLRNVYNFSLQPERISNLVKNIRKTFELVESELVEFANFLENLDQSDT